MDEIKEIQRDIEDMLELLYYAAFLTNSATGCVEYINDKDRLKYEMFTALYRLICAVGGLQELKGTDKEAVSSEGEVGKGD